LPAKFIAHGVHIFGISGDTIAEPARARPFSRIPFATAHRPDRDLMATFSPKSADYCRICQRAKGATR